MLKMNWTYSIGAAPLFMLVACAGPAKDPGIESIGVARLITSESSTELSIVGLADNDKEIATLHLRNGTVLPADYPESVQGRELTIEVNGSGTKHVREGFESMRGLPLLSATWESPSDIDLFVQDERVASALARWDVTLIPSDALRARAPASSETAYAACVNAGCVSSSTLQCCLSGSGLEDRTCRAEGDSHKFQRDCVAPGSITCPGGGIYNPPSQLCTGAPSCPSGTFLCQSDTRCCSSACNGAVFGGGGCTACSDTWTSQPFVWQIVSNMSVCSANWVMGAVLTVTASGTDATGSVSSSPGGINSLWTEASQQASFTINQAATLTASPAGSNARAVFSGDCSATGAYGATATCSVVMGSNKSVTVTFECASGHICPF